MRQTGPRTPYEPIRDAQAGRTGVLDGTGIRDMGKFPIKRANRKYSEAQVHYMRRRGIKPGGKDL